MRSDSHPGTPEDNFHEPHFFNINGSVFPAILNTLGEPFFLFDDKFKLRWHNKACNDIYQYVSGKPIDSSFDFNELLTKEQQPVFNDHLNKVLKGSKEHFEWNYKRSITKWLSVSLYPFTADGGKFAGICGSLRDITEKKINELILLRNTAVLNNISDAVIYADPDDRVVYFNKSAEKIYGIPSYEITGLRLADVICYEYIDDTKKNAMKVIREKGNWEGKIVYTRKDGNKVYMLAAITRLMDKNENIIGLITTNKDITEEELNRQQVFQHQDNINGIINNIKEGVLLIDRNFTILTFNQRAYDLEKKIGTTLRAGENLAGLMPEYRKKPVLQYLDLTLKDKPVEYEVLYPGGTWLLIYFVPVKNNKGDIKQVCITYRDITERKHAEERISANEKKYRTLVNSLSEGVILQTLDNKILTVNKSAELILGLTTDQLIQNGFPFAGLEIVDEDEKEFSYEQLFFKKEGGGINFVKNKVIGLRKGGHIQWLRFNSAGVSNFKFKEINAVVISFEDITEQKRISGEMEVLSMIAKETGNSIIIFDKNSGNTLWINEGFTRLTGYKEEDIIGKNPVTVLAGYKTNKASLKYMSEQIENDLPYGGDILIYAKDGSKRLHQVTGQPIKDTNGRVTKYFAIGTDITERRRMEEERLQKEIEQQKEITRVTLETREAERNELGRELHDNINQILAAVKLQLSYCLKDYKAGKPVVERSLENIKEATDEIRKLSHKMVMPGFSESSLQDKLTGLIANYNYAQSIHLKAMEWQDETIPPAVKETFFRVAQEQLSNIQKHAHAGKVIIQLKSDTGMAIMSIEDNGIGFDPAQKRNGIGFTNICSRVELYHGACQLISAPGKGCTLSVSIPLKK